MSDSRVLAPHPAATAHAAADPGMAGVEDCRQAVFGAED
jgi:hypothetical protein